LFKKAVKKQCSLNFVYRSILFYQSDVKTSFVNLIGYFLGVKRSLKYSELNIENLFCSLTQSLVKCLVDEQLEQDLIIELKSTGLLSLYFRHTEGQSLTEWYVFL
jgi:hypothetical protein